MWDENVHHPINAYLFSPFSIRWNQLSAVAFSEGNTANIHRALDADETMGFVTGAQRGVSASGLQEDRMRTRRTLILAEKQLKPYFPEQFERDVAFYYRGQDGTIFKLYRDRGMHRVVQRISLGGVPYELTIPQSEELSGADREGSGKLYYLGEDGVLIRWGPSQ